MKRINSILIIFLFTLLFSSGLYASSMHEITGLVTLVGDNVVRIQSDMGPVYNIHSAQSKLKDVSTGYRVQATEKNGSLINIEVIGVPVEAAPIIIRTRTVIIE